MIKNIVRGFFHLALTVTIVLSYVYLPESIFIYGGFKIYLWIASPLLVLSLVALTLDIAMVALKEARNSLFWVSLILESLMLIYWCISFIMAIAEFLWLEVVGVGLAVLFSAVASLVIASRELQADRTASFSVVLVGGLIGVITSLILGVILAGVLMLNPNAADFFAILYFVSYLIFPSCAMAGLITGTGLTLIGIRTRTGLEWALVTGIGYALGAWVTYITDTYDITIDAFVFGLIGTAITSCLVVWMIRSILGKRLPRGPFHPEALVCYSTGLLFMTSFVYFFYGHLYDLF